MLHIDVFKLFSSKDKFTRRTGWSLFLAAYSLFLVDLFLWRFPQPEMASPLLQVEQVGQRQSVYYKVIMWALSTNLNSSVAGGTACLEAGSWPSQPEKGDCLTVQNCYCVLPCWLIMFPIIKPRKQDQSKWSWSQSKIPGFWEKAQIIRAFMAWLSLQTKSTCPIASCRYLFLTMFEKLKKYI